MGKNAKVGGILSIVSGVFGILGGCFYILMIFFINFMMTSVPPQQPMEPELPVDFFQFMAILYGGIGLILALIGVLAIVGGAFALKRKNWGLALAGAIAGTVVFFPCGIPAIIFASLGKDEFIPASPTFQAD